MSLEAKDIKKKIRKLRNLGKFISSSMKACAAVTSIYPKPSEKTKGYSWCEIQELHFYMREKEIPIQIIEIVDCLSKKNSYDERRKSCYKENLETLIDHYKSTFINLDFSEMVIFSRKLPDIRYHIT